MNNLSRTLLLVTLLINGADAMDMATGKLEGDIRAQYYSETTEGYTDAANVKHDPEPALGMSGIGINLVTTLDSGTGVQVELGAGMAIPTSETNSTDAGSNAFGRVNDAGDGSEMYTTLTRANVSAASYCGFFKIGYQELDTPMAGSDDVRLVPNSFLAATAGHTGIKNVALVATYISQMAGLVDGNADHAERYSSMAAQTVGSTYLDGNTTTDVEEIPVLAVAAIYENEEQAFNWQVWQYMMAEPVPGMGAVTSGYADTSIGMGPMTLSAQYITFDTEQWSNTAAGLMAEFSFGAFGMSAAANTYMFEDNGAGSVQTPLYYAWGGYPEYVAGEEVDASGADWDNGSSYMVSMAYDEPGFLNASATYLSYSDVYDVVDLIVGYEGEHTHINMVYEMVTVADNKVEGNYAVGKVHLSYHF